MLWNMFIRISDIKYGVCCWVSNWNFRGQVQFGMKIHTRCPCKRLVEKLVATNEFCIKRVETSKLTKGRKRWDDKSFHWKIQASRNPKMTLRRVLQKCSCKIMRFTNKKKHTHDSWCKFCCISLYFQTNKCTRSLGNGLSQSRYAKWRNATHSGNQINAA